VSKKPEPMYKLLSNQDQGLNRLISQARILTDVKIIINQVIDYQIAEHTDVAKIQGGLLTLICDSSVWATRLRYMEPQIIKKLHQFSMLKKLQKIEIKVRPSTFKPPEQQEKPKRRAELSQNAANKIVNDSEAISDPALQNALKKLARHAKS